MKLQVNNSTWLNKSTIQVNNYKSIIQLAGGKPVGYLRGFELGTTVNKSSLRSRRDLIPRLPNRKSSALTTRLRCLLVCLLVITNYILKLPEVTVSPAWKIELTFFGFSYSCWVIKMFPRSLNSLKFGGFNASNLLLWTSSSLEIKTLFSMRALFNSIATENVFENYNWSGHIIRQVEKCESKTELIVLWWGGPSIKAWT